MIVFSPANEADFERLLALRDLVMRPHLERLGRYEPERSRTRFRQAFDPATMRLILADDEFVGCVSVSVKTGHIELGQFYLTPEQQGRSLGSHIIALLLAEADAARLPVRLHVLKQSPAARFYERHGFVRTHEEEWDVFYERHAPKQPRSTLCRSSSDDTIRSMQPSSERPRLTPGTLTTVIEGRTFGARFERFHGPADNVPLSDDDLEHCRASLGRCRRIALRAHAFVEEAGLDPEVALRGGNWAIEKVPLDFDRLVNGDAMAINNLRLLTYLFTGNRLFDFKHYGSHEWDKETPVQLPDTAEELDRTIRANEHELFELATLSSYLTTLHWHPELPLPHVPRVFGEVGWIIDGRLFNDDVYVHYTYLQGLAQSGILGFLDALTRTGRRPRIVEIGPGWGFLAYNLKRLVPAATYVCIDIPESLAFSYLYLSTLYGHERSVLLDEADLPTVPSDFDSLFVSSHFAPIVIDDLGPADLVINTTSLPEMHPKQIDFYAEVASRMVSNTGLFFEVNQTSPVVFDRMSGTFRHRHSMETRAEHKYMNFYYRGTPHIWSNRPFGELVHPG